MDDIAPELRTAYNQVLRDIRRDDPYWTDRFRSASTIGLLDVLKAHFVLGDHFQTTGLDIMSVGLKDRGLLESALGRQFAQFGGVKRWTTPIELVATLFFGIVKNHAFVDGNKRTGLLVALYHLIKVGRVPTASERELESSL